MMNNDFNGKRFAFSLACASLLVTGANAFTIIEDSTKVTKSLVGETTENAPKSELQDRALTFSGSSGSVVIDIRGLSNVTSDDLAKITFQGLSTDTKVGILNQATFGNLTIQSNQTELRSTQNPVYGVKNRGTMGSVKLQGENVKMSQRAYFLYNDGSLMGDVVLNALGTIELAIDLTTTTANNPTATETQLITNNASTMGSVSVFAKEIALNASHKGTANLLSNIAPLASSKMGKLGSVEIKADAIRVKNSGEGRTFLVWNSTSPVSMSSNAVIEGDVTIQAGEITLSGGVSGDRTAVVNNTRGRITGTLTLDANIKVDSGTASALLNTGTIQEVVNKGVITNALLNNEKGVITNFVNYGVINTTWTAGKIQHFTNAQNAAITLEKTLDIHEVESATPSTFTNHGSLKSSVDAIAFGPQGKITILNTGVITSDASAFKVGENVAVDISNRGEIRVGANSYHVRGSGGSVFNIKEWRLVNIGSAASYDALESKTDGSVLLVSGGSVNVESGGLVIDISQSRAFEIGKVYKAEAFVLKDGAAVDVSADNFRVMDDSYVLSQAELTEEEAKAQNRNGGNAIQKGFVVNIDTSRSAAAVNTQNAVNNSLTRSAFVGNVVGSAVSSAVANFNQVSSNVVDFSKVEKYAQVRSDITDQTYAKDSHLFAMPYYTSTSVKTQVGGNLDGKTYGVIGGLQKRLGDAGVFGVFIGAENAKSSNANLETKDQTFYGGMNYYATLGGNGSLDTFTKGMLRMALTANDITANQGSGESDSHAYGLEAGFGVNLYYSGHTFSPELLLSYDRIKVDGFTLNGNTYKENMVDLIVGKLGMNWFAQWNPSISTNVGVGLRLNFKDSFEQGVLINDQLFSNKTDLAKMHYYANVGLTYAITDALDVSVMYNGDFSSDTQANSGFLRLGYWW